MRYEVFWASLLFLPLVAHAAGVDVALMANERREVSSAHGGAVAGRSILHGNAGFPGLTVRAATDSDEECSDAEEVVGNDEECSDAEEVAGDEDCSDDSTDEEDCDDDAASSVAATPVVALVSASALPAPSVVSVQAPAVIAAAAPATDIVVSAAPVVATSTAAAPTTAAASTVIAAPSIALVNVGNPPVGDMNPVAVPSVVQLSTFTSSAALARSTATYAADNMKSAGTSRAVKGCLLGLALMIAMLAL